VVRLALGTRIRLDRLLSAVVRRVEDARRIHGRVALGAIRGSGNVTGIDSV
jgi:hypothetical protein